MSPDSFFIVADVPYKYAHDDILLPARGRAADYECVDCGASANEWSFDHDTPWERTCYEGSDTSGGWRPYSTDPTDYDPRCWPCHAAYDRSI